MPEIDISLIHSNPYRDFDLHPFDAAQIAKLKDSIDQDGFWASVVGREVSNGYEIAFGHHRVEAARLLGRPSAPIEVRDLTDWQMVRMLASENATQRGSTAAASLDAVAAISKVLSYNLLRCENEATFRRFMGKVDLDFHSCRGRLLSGSGLGRDCIRSVTKGNYSTYQVHVALDALKDSGRMAAIIADARARVDLELRAEQEAAGELLRAAEEQKSKAKTTREKTAASKATNTARRAVTGRTKAVDDTARAVANAESQPVTYDARCGHLFKSDAHAETFRRIVTGETFQSYLKLDQQFAFAKSILASLRENMPNKEVTARDIRAECWSRIETGLGMPKGKMRTAPERPYLEEIKEGLNMLRRAEGDFKRGVALLIRGFQLGERLNPKQVERLNAIEATFDAGWDGMKPYRQAKPTLKLVEGE